MLGQKSLPYSHLVISPYPKEFITQAKIKGEKKVVFRPIRPEDEDLEAGLIESFSLETKHQRFLTFKNLNHEVLSLFTHIDYDRELAIVAEVVEKSKKKFIGVTRMKISNFDNSAEITIAIGDPWQNRGLGNKLFDYMLNIARQKEIKKINIKFYHNNERILHMAKKREFKIIRKGDKYFAELDLGV